MFDAGDGRQVPELGAAKPADAAIGNAEIAAFIGALAGLDTDVDDAERIDQIGLLEQLKAAAAAAQAQVTARFAEACAPGDHLA
jgi:hypothetical protein